MSVHLEVFLRAENLPTRDSWQRAIDAEGIDLQLDNVDTLALRGFWPCKLSGADCGFEYIFDKAEPIGHDTPQKPTERGFWARLFGTASTSESEEPDETDEKERRIGDRDHVVEFVWHASLDDGRAASLAAAVLAKIAHGFLYDPQSGELIPGKDAVGLVLSQDRTDHDIKMEQALRKWGASTERRCPKCAAPCPEYRPRCFVCNYEIGRA